MAQVKLIRIGPIALTNTYTTNILNPGTLTGGVNSPSGNLYLLIKKLFVINKTSSQHTFRLFIGATGGNVAGTEFGGYDRPVVANSVVEIFGGTRLDVADFLVGGADAASSLVIEGEAEIGVA